MQRKRIEYWALIYYCSRILVKNSVIGLDNIVFLSFAKSIALQKKDEDVAGSSTVKSLID